MLNLHLYTFDNPNNGLQASIVRLACLRLRERYLNHASFVSVITGFSSLTQMGHLKMERQMWTTLAAQLCVPANKKHMFAA